MNAEKYVKNKLLALSDKKYKAFHSRLMPNISPDKILGVRTPVLRKFAKEFYKTQESEEFMDILPHEYYEENNLHGMLIEQIRDYNEVIRRMDIFLPYIDNWATCDLISPKVFKTHTNELYIKIVEWIASEYTYTKRFAVKTLMSLYLDGEFSTEHLKLVSGIYSREYYVNMAVAWYFATALAKQYEAALPYLEKQTLDVWTHNKAIQKAIESYRITDEQKNHLRKLKIR